MSVIILLAGFVAVIAAFIWLISMGQTGIVLATIAISALIVSLKDR